MLLQIRPLTTQKVSGPQMKELPSLENAWLLLEDDVIHSFGNMSEMPNFQDIKTLDCSGKTVLPSWCDSHTHLVYAGNREQEFVDATLYKYRKTKRIEFPNDRGVSGLAFTSGEVVHVN